MPIRKCKTVGHEDCRSWEFDFEFDDAPHMGDYTLVASGTNVDAAREVARVHLTTVATQDAGPATCTETEEGEPGPLAIYGWIDVRPECTYDEWPDEDEPIGTEAAGVPCWICKETGRDGSLWNNIKVDTGETVVRFICYGC